METIKSDSPSQAQDNVFRGGFGPDAAPRDLLFPVNANITAYELLAFLPHSLQSANIVYRFISNGATRHVLWVLINVARDLPREWHANRCGTIMYKAMGDAGFENWTVKVHDKWHASRQADWNETILNVTGYQTPSQIRGANIVEDNIPFKSLAAGVRRMPQGDDALDLTRMVHYCVQNPQEEWMYPRDYEKLCKVLGGPAEVRTEHIDRSAFNRWVATIPPPPRVWTDEEIKAAIKAMETKPKRQRADSMRLDTPVPERLSRKATPLEEIRRKKVRGARKRVRLEEIEFFGQDETIVAEERIEQVEQYVRAPPEYVAPPGDVDTPSVSTISLVFAAENNFGETDPFSAYAFGGPRLRPPYRMLQDVQQPDIADSSGWAENLRWAWEQRACFWHVAQTEGWNESPVHMEQIAQTRQKQTWASDELLELLAEADDKEEPNYLTSEQVDEAEGRYGMASF